MPKESPITIHDILRATRTRTNLSVACGVDLLDAKEEYIVQQCCCTAVRGHGLSKTIADAFPNADPYALRTPVSKNVNLAIEEHRPRPGTILVMPGGSETVTGGPRIICAFGQFAMGKPGAYYSRLGVLDTHAAREGYFRSCLKEIAQLSPSSLAFPYKIGCGLAGGNWKRYFYMLLEYADAHPETMVMIYRIDMPPDLDVHDAKT